MKEMTIDLYKTLETSCPRPEWVKGAITLHDAKIFVDLIGRGCRGPLLEIGVASGWSTSMLLRLFEKVPPCDGVWLHSYDVIDYCYFDTSKKIGAAVDEVVPHLKDHWQIHLGGAIDAGKSHADDPFGWAFIDANHNHPWACIDLISLLPALKADAWVALHDINLPRTTSVEANKVYGPKHLFDAWPWEKISTDMEIPNMGAIKLPSDHAKVRAFCIDLLKKPWESEMPDDILAELNLLEYKP